MKRKYFLKEKNKNKTKKKWIPIPKNCLNKKIIYFYSNRSHETGVQKYSWNMKEIGEENFCFLIENENEKNKF